VKKTKVLILFGGYSTEHEVSVNSARNVIQAIDKEKYEPIIVGLTKESGTWYYFTGTQLPNAVTTVSDSSNSLENVVNLRKTGQSVCLMNDTGSINIPIDFVLPILHGKYGEDGCLQGLCRMFNLPFAGPAVASSAACMDKDFTKRILESCGIPIGPYMTVYAGEKITYENVIKQLGSPFFLKPANTGSSVGVYKIKTQKDFETYLPIVFQYDEKIVIEQHIQGKEIECAVLGNQESVTSVLGEIKPNHEFYSYESKYIDPNGADLIIPAPLDQETTKKVQQYALKAYKALGCKGFSRVDFFVTSSNDIYLNEINTIPGFTNISMYPKLFEASGISYSDLISRIIELGIQDYKNWIALSTEHHLVS
jgi:D-alanine-D-alanine ligase